MRLYRDTRSLRVMFDNATIIEDQTGYLVSLYEKVDEIYILREAINNVPSLNSAFGILLDHELSSLATTIQAEDLRKAIYRFNRKIIDQLRDLPRRPYNFNNQEFKEI